MFLASYKDENIILTIVLGLVDDIKILLKREKKWIFVLRVGKTTISYPSITNNQDVGIAFKNCDIIID